jgi:hypothetical protein
MAAPPCYMKRMKTEKPTPSLDDIELYPDAMERLERAIKTAVRRGPIPKTAITRKVRKRPAKPQVIPRRRP